MAFDGFFIQRLLQELKPQVVNSRVEKIEYFDNIFSFVLYKQGKRSFLSINLDAQLGLFFSNKLETVEYQHFNNLLKKHLGGGIITSINQYLTDRVIVFSIRTNDFIDGLINYQLIYEAMGRHANLILVKDHLIVDAYKKNFILDGRSIVPNISYEYLASNKKEFHDIDYSMVLTSNDLVQQYLGISPLLANFLFSNQVQLATIITNPTLELSGSKFYVFNLFSNLDVKHFPNLSALLDSRIVVEKTASFQKHYGFIKKQQERLQKRQVKLHQAIHIANKDLGVKDLADSIYSSGQDLKVKTKYFQNKELDEDLSLNDNAQKLYHKYHKAKRTISHVNNQLLFVKNDLYHLQELETSLLFLNKTSIDEINVQLAKYGFNDFAKVKKKKSKTPDVTNIQLPDGSQIMIGTNSTQNEYLIRNISRNSDHWFHVKNAPGGHIILRTTNLTEKNIRITAMVAAYFSSLKESSSIPVDYTLMKNTKKITGQPGFNLTYTKHQTIYIDIDTILVESLLKD